MDRRNIRLRHTSRYIALLLVLTLALGACDTFGDDDDDDMGDASGPPQATATSSGDDQPTEPADGDDATPTAAGEDGEASPTPQDENAEATPGEETAGTDLSAMPEDGFGFGSEASEDRIAEWNIDIAPDGTGLPEGSGTVEEGMGVYNAECARCHGAEGQGGDIGPQLIAESDVWQPGETRTVNNYWPYATTIWDYTYRAMPFDNPNSLEPDQVYAVTAYLLNLGGIIGEDEEMNAETLPQVEMPNRENFNVQCWPDQCLPEAQR